MNYSKKQMKPLIDKFAINPETNKLFIKICEMFDGQPNYQLWAVKMVFSMALAFTDLEKIHDWIIKNSTSINKLEKQNIVSYSNKTLAARLMKEIEGIERINFIKGIVAHFNTEQRRILNDAILKDVTPYEAATSSTIKKWYKMFKAFDKKPMSIKNKFYSTCSALKNIEILQLTIEKCLEESYNWDAGKEDLLAFVEHNASDCDVVFNEGDCVILEVPSFDSSQKLCGGGRTGWCLSRTEDFFSQYVYGDRKQYFLFDFSRKEADAFAHIGFTIQKGSGIVEAQTSHNRPMCTQKHTQGNESLDIHDVFNHFGIDMSIFMKIRSLSFDWDLCKVLDMVKSEPSNFSIAYNNNGYLIISIMSWEGLSEMVDNTYINKNSVGFYEKDKTYLLLDFNKNFSEDKSMILMKYNKDIYGTQSFSFSETIYGQRLTEEDLEAYLNTLEMSSNDFVNKEVIDPSILLHKYIDNMNEKAAIELINKERDNIDINYEFNYRVPVLSAVANKMYDLFGVIVNHEKFDSKIENGFGETLLGSLLFVYGNTNIQLSKEDRAALETMINHLLASEYYDFNCKDENNCAAINIACEYPNENWVVKILASKEEVDINGVDDFGDTPLATCLKHNNMEALRAIGQRVDLKVRAKDKKLATELEINLKDSINPTEKIFDKHKVKSKTSTKKKPTLQPIAVEAIETALEAPNYF